MVEKRDGSGGRKVGKKWSHEKAVKTITKIGEYLSSVNSGQCGVAGIVAKGKNITRTWKGSVVEPYKVLWRPFVEWCYSSLVDCRHVVWYMQCSWCENADTWFSITTLVAQTTQFGMPNVSSTKRERVERIIKGHEIRDGNDVWGGGGGGGGLWAS